MQNARSFQGSCTGRESNPDLCLEIFSRLIAATKITDKVLMSAVKLLLNLFPLCLWRCMCLFPLCAGSNPCCSSDGAHGGLLLVKGFENVG